MVSGVSKIFSTRSSVPKFKSFVMKYPCGSLELFASLWSCPSLIITLVGDIKCNKIIEPLHYG